MLFNNEAYQRRLDEIKEGIKQLVDQFEPLDHEVWHKDVSFRYGRFLSERTLDQLHRAIQLFPGYEHVDDKQKHRDYCAQELMGVVAGLHASSALIRGSVLIADPLGAEGMMRIYEEANAPKENLEERKAPAETAN